MRGAEPSTLVNLETIWYPRTRETRNSSCTDETDSGVHQYPSTPGY
jgi:hypothetical protein